MASKSYIENNLKIIARLFKTAKGDKEPLLLSKLAIVEFCGWIEDSFDEVFYKCLRKNIRERRNIEHIEKAITLNSGFSYKRHFRNTLASIIGYKHFENIERKCNSLIIDRFRNALNKLEAPRNTEAHSYIKSVRNIDSPSVIISLIPDIYNGLCEILKQLKKHKLV
ncbi:MAG: hypothetical protein WC855_15115 [Thermodesulfovibrionales bacterium]